MKRLFSLLFILFIIGCNDTKTTLPDIEASFRQTECFSNTVDNTGIICGYIDVPNDYFNKTATYSLPIAIKKTTSENKLPPLIFLAGGPGSSSIENYTYWLERMGYKDRDIIVYDQRGTGFSKPFLECDEINKKYNESNLFNQNNINIYSDEFDEDTFNQYFRENYLNNFTECKQKLIDDNQSPIYFNSRNSAYDLEAIRKTFNLEKITILGVSYGTRLALEYMYLYPLNIDSMILDSVLPENVEKNSVELTKTKNVVIKLFDLCANDIICQQTYPNLKNEFLYIIDKLNQTPYEKTYISTKTGEENNVILTGSEVSRYVYLKSYNENYISTLPFLIHYVYQNLLVDDYTYIDSLIESNGFNSDYGEYFSNIMQMIVNYNDSPFNYDNLIYNYENLGEYEDVFRKINIFSIWLEYSTFSQKNHLKEYKFNNNIPTLILSGELDPNTPVVYAQNVHDRLNNSTMLVFKNTAHDVEKNSCGRETIQKFLDDTNNFTPPECVNDENKINFYIPDNL